MPRDKTLSIQAPSEQLGELVDVLGRYADAAWPPGGSECAQASRDALMTTAESLRRQLLDQPKQLEFSRRQRATFRAALEYHLQLPEYQDRQDMYLNLLNQLTSR
jgi:hypothetical protein